METEDKNINDDIAEKVQARADIEKNELYNIKDIPDEITSAFVERCLCENERGDGMLFYIKFKNKFLHNYSLGKTGEWMIFEDHRWKFDVLKKSLTAVTEIANIYKKEAISLSKKIGKLAKDGKLKDELKPHKDLRKFYNGRITKLLSDKGRKTVLSLAATLETPMATDGFEFDKNPDLLCCLNGVVDLRTGKLRDGKPEDFISRCTDANCPADLNKEPVVFVKALSEICQNKKAAERPEMVAFLHRLLGSTLRGKREENIFIMLGGARGQNGKGTIKNLMLHTLKDYAWPIPSSMLIKKKFGKSEDAATPTLEKVKNIRFLVASETSMGEIFDGGKVKEMSGGDPFQSRGNYGEFDWYWPTHTLFLLTNHPPHHPAEDSAFWHRMIKLSFEWSYVNNPNKKYERKADLSLWANLLKEKDQFLGWLIRGGLEYDKVGLNIPKSIQLESQRYRREEDDMEDFLLEKCKQGERLEVGSTVIFNVYFEWCKEHLSYEPKQANFGRKMSSMFEKFKRGIYHYRGVRLLEQGEEKDKDELMDDLDDLDGLNELDSLEEAEEKQ